MNSQIPMDEKEKAVVNQWFNLKWYLTYAFC